MEVIFNQEKITTRAATLSELIAERLPDTKGIAVALGNTVIPRTQWPETPLTDQAVITVIRAIRGG
ncbi:MAG: sulfur carrier protein ThiS [Rikenellaceae bacterium]|nr:sulfur carrier protein ThiS [Rikenellaceae bacterium]